MQNANKWRYDKQLIRDFIIFEYLRIHIGSFFNINGKTGISDMIAG